MMIIAAAYVALKQIFEIRYHSAVHILVFSTLWKIFENLHRLYYSYVLFFSFFLLGIVIDSNQIALG